MLKTQIQPQIQILDQEQYSKSNIKRNDLNHQFQKIQSLKNQQKTLSENQNKQKLINSITSQKRNKYKVKKIIKTQIIFIETIQCPNKRKNQKREISLKKPLKQNDNNQKKTLYRNLSQAQLKNLDFKHQTCASTLTSSEKSCKQSFNASQTVQQDRLERQIEFRPLKNKINLVKSFNLSKINDQQIQNLKIDDFEIVKSCGQSSSGSSYIARHKKTGFLCTLNKIQKRFFPNFQDKQALIQQIKTHMSLSHPNIIKFYGFFSDPSSIYLVLELCIEGNLYQMLQKYLCFQEKQVKNIIRQVCSGINYLHSFNIIHGGIESKNIVIHEKTVKICDFSQSIKHKESSQTLCETKASMLHERHQKLIYYKKIDIWSLGILTYQLVYGKIQCLFQSEQDFSRLHSQQINFPNQIEISDACKNFIKQCLQKNPKKRQGASQLLLHQFLRIH